MKTYLLFKIAVVLMKTRETKVVFQDVILTEFCGNVEIYDMAVLIAEVLGFLIR